MSASRKNPALDRAVRIELLRARSALEREAICHRCHQVRESVGGISRSFSLLNVGRRLFRGGMPQWLSLAGDAGRRYPLLTSALSTLLLGRKSRAIKAGGLAVTAWQLYRSWTAKKRRPKETDTP